MIQDCYTVKTSDAFERAFWMFNNRGPALLTLHASKSSGRKITQTV